MGRLGKGERGTPRTMNCELVLARAGTAGASGIEVRSNGGQDGEGLWKGR